MNFLIIKDQRSRSKINYYIGFSLNLAIFEQFWEGNSESGNVWCDFSGNMILIFDLFVEKDQDQRSKIKINDLDL